MDIEYKRVTKAFAREFFKLGDEYGFHVFSAIGNSGGSVELMLEGLNVMVDWRERHVSYEGLQTRVTVLRTDPQGLHLHPFESSMQFETTGGKLLIRFHGFERKLFRVLRSAERALY